MAGDSQWLFPASPRVDPIPGLPAAAAVLLANRGIKADARFLSPKLADLSDPFDFPEMESVVARLLQAVDGGERVCLYSDYDVDGVTSAALLALVMEGYGLEPDVFLPHRMEEGYGLSADGIGRCLRECRPDLLVAIDCGTTSLAEAEELRRRKVDLLILDHHEASPDGRPACLGMVNPKLDQLHPYLCSVGVVFKVAHALLKARPLPRRRFDLREHLDLVALGTVADIVPLEGENRLLVRHGINVIRKTGRPGLVALKRAVGLYDRVSAGDIGFRLGPRLNAAGRLDTARDAFELLRCTDAVRAAELAAHLDARNRERQAVEQAIVEEAMQLATGDVEAGYPVLVLARKDWHPGVVGIVASRLMRHFHRPAVVIGFDENGLGKGSARSVEGISVVEALDVCRDHLVKWGGHAMAAGLAIQEEALPAFAEALRAHIAANAAPSCFLPVIRPDIVVGLDEVDFDLLDAWEKLGPFGAGFPEPVLAARRVRPLRPPYVIKEKHIKFVLENRNGGVEAIWFNGLASGELPPPPWDLAFIVHAREWQGEISPQIQVRALRAAAG